jgi:hypothetical protein
MCTRDVAAADVTPAGALGPGPPDELPPEDEVAAVIVVDAPGLAVACVDVGASTFACCVEHVQSGAAASDDFVTFASVFVTAVAVAPVEVFATESITFGADATTVSTTFDVDATTVPTVAGAFFTVRVTAAVTDVTGVVFTGAELATFVAVCCTGAAAF